jgi:hypothetical protein
MKNLWREPLVHFLIIGAVLFLLFGLFNNPAGPQSGRIVIKQGQIDFLKANFTRTWKRSPTEKELQGLIAGHLRDEIFFQEALAMGLDKDDAVIRQRLKQKLEIMSDDLAGMVIPTDEELNQFLTTHPKRFIIEPQVAFHHVFISYDQRGYSARDEAVRLLAQLSKKGSATNPDTLPDTVGDSLMLPKSFDLSSASVVARFFGESFSRDIMKVTPGQWAGPLESGYGLHLVWVDQHVKGRLPKLNEIRKIVEQEWSVVHKKKLKDDLYKKLREKYTITFEQPKNKTNTIGKVSEGKTTTEQKK